MNISEICTREVVTCPRTLGVEELARLMRDRHVGNVIVIEQSTRAPVPVGIVTDRDLVVRVIAQGVAPSALTAGDVMDGALSTALGSESVYDAVWHMRSRGIRRLPVVDEHGGLVGLITADDLVRFIATELTELGAIAPRQARMEQRAFEPSPG